MHIILHIIRQVYYWQDVIGSKFEHVETPINHESIQQGSMAPPIAISTDQLVDSNMSL